VVHDVPDVPARIAGVDLVVDAAFGTGFRGSWTPPEIGGIPVLAVDVPSGLDARTGEVAGPVLRAVSTITFAALRPGHLLGSGPRWCGEVVVADIGLDATTRISGGHVPMRLIERSDVAAWVPRRSRSANKWTSAVRLVAGSPGMTGAAHLAAAAAQRAGAGMVVVSSPGIDASSPVEAVDRRIPPFDWASAVLGGLDRFHALVIGPGLGREEYTVPSVVRTIEHAPLPVVVDGDALFALAWNQSGSPSVLADRAGPTVLTPHDGEFATLTGQPPGPDRVAAVREFAERTGAIVLLKGPTTLVSGPEGPVWFVDHGDERLATAGTGDVLAGIIGALVAGGLDPIRAAAAGAWIHGEAGRTTTRAGVVAGDLVGALPTVMSSLARNLPTSVYPAVRLVTDG
jgi:NAD(P)H-hydrate epimerase